MKKLIIFIVVIGVAGYFGYPYYVLYSISNQSTFVEIDNDVSIQLEHDMSIEEFSKLLEEKQIITNSNDFEKLINYKGYENDTLSSGNFKLLKEWSTYKSLANNIHVYANQKRRIVNVIITNVRTIEDIAGLVANKIDADSTSLSNVFNNDSIIHHYGFEKEVFPTFFLPNTYECYSDITPEAFIQKLASAYKEFWNEDRVQKALNLGLTQSEVTILASIVYEEQKVKFDEQPKIAGLYINRLKNGWKLQADPTVKYAVGDFTLRRVLFKHLEVDSPYNTYKYQGLPPGPISIPEPRTIDAVLDYEVHDYFYMCAKPEYTGYHNFSKTLNQHNVYASEYQKWLKQQNIH